MFHRCSSCFLFESAISKPVARTCRAAVRKFTLDHAAIAVNRDQVGPGTVDPEHAHFFGDRDWRPPMPSARMSFWAFHLGSSWNSISPPAVSLSAPGGLATLNYTDPLYTAGMTEHQRAWFYAEYEQARRDEVVGVLLAVFLGNFGLHHFYLRRTGLGVLYLLFSWTGIPAILGFIEAFFMPRPSPHLQRHAGQLHRGTDPRQQRLRIPPAARGLSGRGMSGLRSRPHNAELTQQFCPRCGDGHYRTACRLTTARRSLRGSPLRVGSRSARSPGDQRRAPIRRDSASEAPPRAHGSSGMAPVRSRISIAIPTDAAEASARAASPTDPPDRP